MLIRKLAAKTYVNVYQTEMSVQCVGLTKWQSIVKPY